jgi:hypothetical protein
VAEIEVRHLALLDIVAEQQPMTARQVFYQATVRAIVEKSETGYDKVQRALAELRRAGRLPFEYISDNTRWVNKPQSFRGPGDALRDTAHYYRKDLWADAEHYVEIWCEKDALAGVLSGVTHALDVPLMVSRGYASLTFLHDAATAIEERDRPAYIYHLGDFDPSGVDAANKVEASLREFAPEADIHFTRLAVLQSQITAWNLPSRPTKQSDSRARGFGDISVELDAIEPSRLRNLIQDAIGQHLPHHQYQVLKAAEQSERATIMSWARSVGGEP